MPLYWILVAGFCCLAAALTTVSNVYWIAVMLIATGGLTGDCLQELIVANDVGSRRARKWFFASSVLTLLGSTCNIALFLVPGLVGLFGQLFAYIARDIEVLRAT